MIQSHIYSSVCYSFQYYYHLLYVNIISIFFALTSPFVVDLLPYKVNQFILIGGPQSLSSRSLVCLIGVGGFDLGAHVILVSSVAFCIVSFLCLFVLYFVLVGNFVALQLPIVSFLFPCTSLCRFM